MMRSSVRATLALGAAAIFGLVLVQGAGAQAAPAKPGERTVEEAYLQESLETMIIKEQSYSDNKDMKLVALKYIKQAVDGGRKNEEIRKSLEFLALETTSVIARSAGLGRPTNNYPDIRAMACEYLGEFPTVESKDALVKVTLGDNEPMVLAAAIRSLGKIGMNGDDEVTQVISYIISRFDVLGPDNSLADDALDAIAAIAEKNGGIKDPAAIRAVMKIASGNYITKVRVKAAVVLDKLRSYQLAQAQPKK
jgi:HEAT repeat protein